MSDNNSDELLEFDNGITDAEHERLDEIARSFRPLWIWRSSNAGSSPSLEDLASILAYVVGKSSKDMNELYENHDAAREFLTSHPHVESRLRAIISSDASFKGIRRLCVLRAPPVDIGFLSQAFYETEYRGTAEEVFLDYILHNDKIFNELKDGEERFYAKFLSIIQSSGTGKSRLVHELGKQGKVILFYMNLGTGEDTFPYQDAFPYKNQTPARLLLPDRTDVQRNLEKYHDLDKRFHNKVQKFEAMYCAFYAAIFQSFVSEAKEFRAKYVTKPDEIPREWYKTFFGRQAFVNRQKLFADMEKHYWKALDAIPRAPAESGDEPQAGKVIGSDVMLKAYSEAVSELNLMPGNNVPLLIVFDEAAKLVEFQQDLEESEVKQSHILCRVINVFSNHYPARIWTVFISANTKIRNFSGSPKTLCTDGLLAKAGRQLLFRPFTELGLHQFAKPFKAIDLERVWEYENMIGFGRPLWKAQGDARRINNLSEVIHFGKRKLTKGGFGGEHKQEQLLAIFSQRLCLDLVLGHRLSVAYEEEAIAGHMRFLITTSEDHRILYSMYPTEPILSQASAEFLWDRSDDYTVTDGIGVLLMRIARGMINQDTSGELAARLLLLFAKDICAKELEPRENELRYCGSVKLIRWLKVLFGEDVFLRQVNGRKLEERVQEHFGNVVVNFSHWIEMLEDEDASDPLHPEWLPHLFAMTGAVCYDLPTSIDNVIPAFDTVTKKVTQVLSQTKASAKSNKTALEAIFPKDIGLPDDSCVIIMMDLKSSRSSVEVTLNGRGTPYLRIHAKGCSGETYVGLKSFMGDIAMMVPEDSKSKFEQDLMRMRERATIFCRPDNDHWED